jgi:hypothetical protein
VIYHNLTAKDKWFGVKHGIPVAWTKASPHKNNLELSWTVGLRVGQRVLITEKTQSSMPRGYNWVGSCPIVKEWGTIDSDHVVMLYQVGYPYLFAVSINEYRQMRRDYIARGE